MGAISRPARSLPMGYQTNLVFQRGRPVLQAQPAERRKIWNVAATIADVLPVRSSRANSVTWPGEASRPFLFFLAGCIPWNFDGLDGFADFGMSESDLRNLCSRCVSEWRGGKSVSPSRMQAEAGRYLVRGTSTSVGAVKPGENSET